MKIKIFLLLIIIIITLVVNVFSQVSREWISTYNFNNDEGKALAVDKFGNTYVTGISGSDYATVKYNSSGVQQWVTKYNGTGNSGDGPWGIALDSAGNVYVTGTSVGIPSGNTDILTVKYNNSGVQQWTARYDGPVNSLDNGFAIAVDASGNVYVTGNTFTGYAPSGSDYDYITIKYNTAGVFQWSKRYNGTGNNTDNAFAIALDSSGNSYVTGWSRGSGSSDDNFATIKYSPAGVELWVRIYEGSGDGFDQATAIAVDRFSNVYVTGRSLGDVTQYDYATIKYNSLGDSLWVRKYNGIENSADNSNSIAVDNSGNVYVTGQSYSSVTDYDFATVKYNSSGVQLWDKLYNGPGNSVENGRVVVVDNSGNVYVTGSSAFAGQNYNYATVKYNSAGVEQWSDTYNGTAGGSDESFSIAVDANSNVYVTGSSAGLGQFKDYVTIKYSQKPYAMITGFIEGFYNPSSDKMISDTAKIYVRNINSPYALVDSSKSKLDSTGKGRFYFSNITNGVSYHIVLKHRNSIETWSSGGNSFTAGVMSYDFTTSSAKAYGNNETQIDASPLRFAIYSGDVDQNGFADLTDINIIFNDASNFVSGYVSSDVNGDNISDLTDLVIAFNNSSNFVSVSRP